MLKLLALVTSVMAAAAFGDVNCTFLPPNDLWKADRLDAKSGITEEQFNAVIERAENLYKPLVNAQGAELTVARRWTDSTVNANASQPSPTRWHVNMYGGLARRPEVTEDGFAMVLCHELGHHLGGFPFVQDWAANEGQSDIHATGACAMKLFAKNDKLSAKAREDVPQDMKDKCDNAHQTDAARDICYRALAAGKSLADLLAALRGETVSFATPDTSVVTRTNHQHPFSQCRLDTYVAGALCGNEKWDYSLIPGKSLDHESIEAQNEAFAHSCVEGAGARPTCWFAALTEEPQPPEEECPLQDPEMCDLLCQMNPELPWCDFK